MGFKGRKCEGKLEGRGTVYWEEDKEREEGGEGAVEYFLL